MAGADISLPYLFLQDPLINLQGRAKFSLHTVSHFCPPASPLNQNGNRLLTDPNTRHVALLERRAGQTERVVAHMQSDRARQRNKGRNQSAIDQRTIWQRSRTLGPQQSLSKSLCWRHKLSSFTRIHVRPHEGFRVCSPVALLPASDSWITGQ